MLRTRVDNNTYIHVLPRRQNFGNDCPARRCGSVRFGSVRYGIFLFSVWRNECEERTEVVEVTGRGRAVHAAVRAPPTEDLLSTNNTRGGSSSSSSSSWRACSAMRRCACLLGRQGPILPAYLPTFLHSWYPHARLFCTDHPTRSVFVVGQMCKNSISMRSTVL